MQDTLNNREHSFEAEQGVLGALLIDSRKVWIKVSPILDADDFSEQDHKTLWNVIENLAKNNIIADIVVVADFLKTNEQLDIVGGSSYLGSLINNTPSTDNAELYAIIVKKHSLKKQIQFARVNDEPVQKIVRLEDHLAEISNANNVSKVFSKKNNIENNDIGKLARLADYHADAGEPIPLQRELTGNNKQEYPIKEMGNMLGNAAIAIQEETQCPLALAAQSVLSAACVACQGLANVKIRHHLTVPLSNYFLTLAESGERKTGVYSLALQAHNEFERKLNSEYSDYLRKKKGDDNSENDKREPILTVEEPTYEGLSKALQRGQPTMGLFSDEGGRFLTGYAMSKDNATKTAAGLSSLWNGKPIDRSRASDGTIKLYDRRLSAHLMVQPKIGLESMLSSNLLNEQGLLARFLISYPKSTIGNRFFKDDKAYTDPRLGDYWARMTELLERYQYNKDGELQFRTLMLTDGAKELWVEFYNYCESKIKTDFDHIRAFALKAPEHVARLAAVLALSSNTDIQYIEYIYIYSSIRLVMYYLDEALRLCGAKNDPQLDKAQTLLNWLRIPSTKAFYDGRGYIRHADVYQRGPAFVRTAADALKFLNVLMNHGYIICEKRGRSRWWMLTEPANLLKNDERTEKQMENKTIELAQPPAKTPANNLKSANETDATLLTLAEDQQDLASKLAPQNAPKIDLDQGVNPPKIDLNQVLIRGKDLFDSHYPHVRRDVLLSKFSSTEIDELVGHGVFVENDNKLWLQFMPN